MNRKISTLLWSGMIASAMLLTACEEEEETPVVRIREQIPVISADEYTPPEMKPAQTAVDIFSYAADDAINLYVELEKFSSLEAVRTFLAQPEQKKLLDSVTGKLKIEGQELSCRALINLYDLDLFTAVLMFRNGGAARLVDALGAMDQDHELQKTEVDGRTVISLEDGENGIQLTLVSADELHVKYKESGAYKKLVRNEENSFFLRRGQAENALLLLNINRSIVNELLEDEEQPFAADILFGLRAAGQKIRFDLEIDLQNSDSAVMFSQQLFPHVDALKQNSGAFVAMLKSEVSPEIRNAVVPLCDDLPGVIQTLSVSQRERYIVASATASEETFTKALSALVQCCRILIFE